MKNKVPKIIFIISFLPYVLALVNGITSAVWGASIFFNTIYGFEGFVFGILFTLYEFVFGIPIIPICLIYQICYILRKKFKKFNNISLKKYVRICCIVGGLLICVLIVSSYSLEIEKFIEKISAKQMINNAEEKIAFNKNDISVGGIFNMPEYKYDHVFIDYDEVEVGMLLNASLDTFWKVELEKVSKDSSTYQHIVEDYYVQADIPLNSPGEKLVSFYEEESNIHRTIALLLIYDDGTIYFADNIKEDKDSTRFTGLQWSEFFPGENIKFNDTLLYR